MRISAKASQQQPRLPYGIVVYDDGKHKHQRFFDEWVDQDDSVEVRLLNGDWILVSKKAIVRYPKGVE